MGKAFCVGVEVGVGWKVLRFEGVGAWYGRRGLDAGVGAGVGVDLPREGCLATCG